jgi:tRNA C32,U32 (ribose-2'-O)-methylase TrmJ
MSKKMNVGMVVRSATAFGVREVIVTGGATRVSTLGAQGTERFIALRCVPKLREAVAELKAAGVTICGIEITPDAAPVQRHPFRGPTAFVAGAEGGGLPDAHKALCDHFVYIPQHGNGTASLNVTVATSIVLHHFAVWAGYPELAREADKEKFVVVPPPQKHGATTAADRAKQAARAAQRAAAPACEDAAPGLAATLAGDEDESEHGDDDVDGEEDG